MVSIVTLPAAYDYTLIRLLIGNIFVFFSTLLLLLKGERYHLSPKVLLPLTAYLFWITVSIPLSSFPAATLREITHILTYALIFLTASQISPSGLIWAWWFLSAFILSVCGLSDYYHIRMVVTPLGNKNFFAGYLVLTIPLVITALWNSARNLKKNHRTKKGEPSSPLPSQREVALFFLLLLCVLFLVTLLFLCNSQSAFLALAVSIMVIFALYFRFFLAPKMKKRNLNFILTGLLIVVLGGGVVGIKKGIPYIQRNVRFPLWTGTITMIAKRPFTGFGPGNFLAAFQRFRPISYYQRPEVAPLSDHSHNEYLEVASESGLPALLFFLFFLGSVLWGIFQKLRTVEKGSPSKKTEMSPSSLFPPERFLLLTGLFSGIVGVLVDGFFSTNLRTYTVASLFWLTLAFCGRETNSLNLNKEMVKSEERKKVRPFSRNVSVSTLVWSLFLMVSLVCALFLTREIKGQVYYKKGVTARNLGDFSSASSYYQKALQLDPANLQAAYKLCFVYANSNRIGEAIALYREILRISPNFAKTYYNLALLHFKIGDKPSALSYLRLSLRYNPYDQDSQKLLNFLSTGKTAVDHKP